MLPLTRTGWGLWQLHNLAATEPLYISTRRHSSKLLKLERAWTEIPTHASSRRRAAGGSNHGMKVMAIGTWVIDQERDAMQRIQSHMLSRGTLPLFTVQPSRF